MAKEKLEKSYQFLRYFVCSNSNIKAQKTSIKEDLISFVDMLPVITR